MDMFGNQKLLAKDKALLEKTKVPIVTVSASFRDELARFHGVDDYFGKTEDEVLFSRAHYSMALGAAMSQWTHGIDPARAWLVDPTNYVTRKDWAKIEFTEEVGKVLARNKLLKILKDRIDERARGKLPITGAITTPLLYLFESVHSPILSFHYEAGNILAGVGKQVIQVITDPHVRPQYLVHAELPTVRYCVFDENTRESVFELAEVMDKEIDPRRVIVTGPPVDPRIIQARRHKKTTDHLNRPLRLVITTGGLGTNKSEIEDCVRSLAPLLRHQALLPYQAAVGRKPTDFGVQLIVFVGTHQDLRESIHTIANQEGLTTAARGDETASLRILYSPHIVEANELLIKHAFPWTDGFISKPSGDMAYDAVAAGCFLLTLDPWGEWEHNIRDIFEQREISRRAIPTELTDQLRSLATERGGKAWITQALENVHKVPELFLKGTENIVQQVIGK